ncbi:hypothetical protein K443DRAFT_114811 [Laccaria amethystina LaAM-08-1]|uniref:SWIM-type domain-containing protein n=1 Tax=Laccaria amethystina LaAM-08-1 TaxID=1095629 RepID=A0A0C9X1T6_9AGAR|nr:hypothetical protein K443DRAFT_114811 [Laccaria amethystina LaAM-08-1]
MRHWAAFLTNLYIRQSVSNCLSKIFCLLAYNFGQSSRRQHDRPIETIFPGSLKILREHAGPFALNTCFREMELSLTYSTEVLQRPDGINNWNMVNPFTNDAAYISTKWLLRLTLQRGLRVRHLLCVKRMGTNTKHYLAVLSDGCYVCDCCMGLNLGLPCRHFFQVMLKMESLQFHIGLVRAR